MQFIVGQVTPSMIKHLTYGTYIFFGLLTFGGAAFIYFFFPETKGLSLEEMDILFGSAGAAAADAERMREINKEVGLVSSPNSFRISMVKNILTRSQEDAVRGNSVTVPIDEKPKAEEKVSDAGSE